MSAAALVTLLALPFAAEPAQCHGRPAWDEPVVARTEITGRALELPPELDARIQAARRKAWTAARDGAADVDALYEAVWQLLPEPRAEWDSSYVIADDAVEHHFDAGRYDDALRWLARANAALANTTNPAILAWLGKIRYRQGRFDEAYACFDAAHREWGTRPFGDRPDEAEYLEFYRGRHRPVGASTDAFAP
ncbi:MAG TPA: tetratricopeptide repeat protein [Xanthomonadales bacterium]|nr:tetratricopeptide repeat protein [Xanthomonadales bacterium]